MYAYSAYNLGRLFQKHYLTNNNFLETTIDSNTNHNFLCNAKGKIGKKQKLAAKRYLIVTVGMERHILIQCASLLTT